MSHKDKDKNSFLQITDWSKLRLVMQYFEWIDVFIAKSGVDKGLFIYDPAVGGWSNLNWNYKNFEPPSES